MSESSRQKRPPLDAAKKKYEDALSKVNQELKEFLDTYPRGVFVPILERPETNARYKKLKGRWLILGSEADELRALLTSNALTQEKNVLDQTLKDLDAEISLKLPEAKNDPDT